MNFLFVLWSILSLFLHTNADCTIEGCGCECTSTQDSSCSGDNNNIVEINGIDTNEECCALCTASVECVRWVRGININAGRNENKCFLLRNQCTPMFNAGYNMGDPITDKCECGDSSCADEVVVECPVESCVAWGLSQGIDCQCRKSCDGRGCNGGFGSGSDRRRLKNDRANKNKNKGGGSFGCESGGHCCCSATDSCTGTIIDQEEDSGICKICTECQCEDDQCDEGDDVDAMADFFKPLLDDDGSIEYTLSLSPLFTVTIIIVMLVISVYASIYYIKNKATETAKH